jgi:FMN-dependent NADH-azoreductase
VTTLLYIEASPRKARSHSIRVADAFVRAYAATNPSHQIERLDLWDADLPRFDGEMLDAKYAIMHGEEPSPAQREAWVEVERLCARFAAANKYLLSTPMWNFGLPYILKQYIDVITQPDLTWKFSPDAGYAGLVAGKAAVVYSSGSAYDAGSEAESLDFQKPSLTGWLAFIGITDVTSIVAAPTLAPQDAVEATIAAAVEHAESVAKSF